MAKENGREGKVKKRQKIEEQKSTHITKTFHSNFLKGTSQSSTLFRNESGNVFCLFFILNFILTFQMKQQKKKKTTEI